MVVRELESLATGLGDCQAGNRGELARKGFAPLLDLHFQTETQGPTRSGPRDQGLIRKTAEANPLWGAPRIYGGLLKLGIEISERTVSRLLPRHHQPPSQRWRAFLENHVKGLVAIDFFPVPTATLSAPGSGQDLW
jgi:hypothetical protein